MKSNNQFKSITNNLGLLVMVMLWAILPNAYGQYCTSNATSTADEYISNVKLVQGNNVLLDNNSSQIGQTACAQYTDFTSLPAIPLSAGATYTVSVRVAYCGAGVFNNQALVWIDYNRNNVFEASEAVRSTPFAFASGVRDISYTFTVPCNINPGNTRMRCVLIETTAMTNPGNACGTYAWGETEDYTVNLQLPTQLSSNFAAPTSAWVKSVVKFVNSNQTGYISHSWDADLNGVDAPNSVNFNYTWNTGGTKCVKLRSTNCLGSDSTTKCLTINTPTVVPDAQFVADRVVVEQYDKVKLFDLSDYGPYQWNWSVYDSTDVNDVKDVLSGDVDPDPDNNGSNAFTQNPEFAFYRPGCYTVVLTARNDIGLSAPKRKVCYITVTLPTQYLLGFGSYGPNNDNVVESPSGTIIDNGGTGLNYGNNQGLGTRSFVRITPCNAKKITLTMSQLKFADKSDILTVWDGKSPGGPGSTQIAAWTNGVTTPRSVTATSGSMYILFVSNSSGVDSGYIGTYVSELASANPPTPTFTPSTTPSYNNTPVRFTNTTQDVVGVPTWTWTVDGDLVGIYDRQDFNYNFTTDGNYNVCLEVKSCVGNKKSCNTISVVTPQTQTSLDIAASNRRPNVTSDVIRLMPISDNANRFEWSIFPTTYTLVNAPTSPSVSGTGFVYYRSTPGDSIPTPMIRFNQPGCYTITLKAWNSNNKNATEKTIVKNQFVCAVQYCTPGSFVNAADLTINKVVLADGNNALIDNYTTNTDAYLNFTKNNVASLTYGKTYSIQVARNTNADPANRKGWIDWNIDGDFDDAGEEIFFESTTSNLTYTANFTVPSLSNSFEGTTRLRLAINFNNSNTTPCGPATAGQYHDYGIVLFNDNMKPVITLLGNDTVRMEVGGTYTDAGATGFDASEGDITSRIVTTNDLDVTVTGIYSYEYNLTDNSGNKAEAKFRTIIVVNDMTPPTITLNPGSSTCIEVDRNNTPYVDPGATAANTNPFVNLTSAIRTSGTVNTREVGNYTITYSVRDFAGNLATATRNVCVEDTKAPLIKGTGDTSIQIGTLWIDQTFAEDAYDNNPELMKSWFPEIVNSSLKGTYTVTYTAKDAEGNISAPKVVNYRVDDFVPPTINLNTFDVVEHDVTIPYVSVQASATDNYYGQGQVSISRISTNVNSNEVGTYTEVFKAVDGSGNVTIKTRTVNVIDRIAPVLWGGTIYGCVGENIWPMSGLTTTDNYYGPQILLPNVEIVNQNVNPMEEGIYFITYKVKDPSNNTSAPLTRQVVYTYWPRCINSTVDVDVVKSIENSINLFPNPSNGIVNIDFNGNVANNPQVKVFNQLGQLVFTQNNTTATANLSLDLSGFAKGIYSVNIISEGVSVTKRVVLQ